MFSDLDKELINYIREKNVTKIDETIKKGANVKANDEEFKSAIMYAFEYNVGIDIINKIIQYGANINAKDDENRTVLMYALKYNTSYDIIKLLVKLGANVNAKDVDSNNVLMYAARHENLEVLKYFIELCKIDLSYKNEFGQSIVMYAARYNENSEILDFLIETYGFDVHEKDSWRGMSILMLAAWNNKNPQIIDLLISKYKLEVNDRDKDGNTALMYAAEGNSNPEVIKRLLTLGADINMYNDLEETAIQLAAEHNPNPKVIKTLVDGGAYVNELILTDRNDFCDSDLPIILAAESNNASVLDMLISCGACVETKAWRDENLLMCAVKWNKNLNVIDLLIDKYGINVNSKNISGETALMITLDAHSCVLRENGQIKQPIDERRIAIFDKLIKKGADIREIDNDNKTVLMHAVCGTENPIQIIERLILQYHLDVNATDSSGRTPLMYAAQSNYNLDIFEVLLVNGANINIKDKRGNSVLSLASGNPREAEVKKLLKKHGAL